MMTSSNEIGFHYTGPFWGESTGHRWIPLTKGQWRGLWYLLWFESKQTNKQTDESPVIQDARILILTSPWCNGVCPDGTKPLPELVLTHQQEMFKRYILHMNLRINNLRLQPHLPGTCELMTGFVIKHSCAGFILPKTSVQWNPSSISLSNTWLIHIHQRIL